MTPDRGAGDGGRPRRLNAAPLSGVDGLPLPLPPSPTGIKASEKPGRVLMDGGRGVEVPLPRRSPPLAPVEALVPPPATALVLLLLLLTLASPPARFWFCMVW